MPVNKRSFPQLPAEQSEELSPATKKHKPGHDRLTEPAPTGIDVDEVLLAGDEVPENVVGSVADEVTQNDVASITANHVAASITKIQEEIQRQQHLTFQDEWTVPESSVMEAYVQYGSRVYTFNSWPRIACKKNSL